MSADQLAEVQSIAPVVCVQSFYNVARRDDDALVDATARQGIAYENIAGAAIHLPPDATAELDAIGG